MYAPSQTHHKINPFGLHVLLYVNTAKQIFDLQDISPKATSQ